MRKTFLAVLLIALLSGCSGAAQIMTPPAARSEQVLGEAEGTGVGFLLLGCIPINHNGRQERAVQEAVARKGGTALVNPRIEERWFWTPAGNGFITTVKGTVVR